MITLVGLAALMTMKKDLHPAFKFNYVNVSLSYPNASADEIERLITYPIEERLRDLPDVEEITSKTKVGFPTAYGLGGESGFTQPLAFSMGWGLTASLGLTLFIIPAMLMVLNDLADLTEKIKNKFANKAASKDHSVSRQSESQLDLNS